jgi:hypothetical protein
MIERVFSALRPLFSSAAMILAGAAVVGCGADDTTHWYLGEVTSPEAGSRPEASLPDTAPPLASLSAASCEVPPLPVPNDNTLASLQTLGQRAMLTTQGSVRALGLGENGCPEQDVSGFGNHGVLSVQALGALPLSANRTLVATTEGFSVLDASGAALGTCASAESPARILTPTGGSSWVTAFRGSPLTAYEAPVGDSAPACQRSGEISLTPAPLLVTSLAKTNAGGWVTVQQQDETSSLTVAVYDSNGKQISSGDSAGFHLCSGTWVVDSPAGYWVVDGACRQIVLFRSDTMVPIAVSRFDTTPLSAAWVDAADLLLVSATRFGPQGSVVEFMTVTPDGA